MWKPFVFSRISSDFYQKVFNTRLLEQLTSILQPKPSHFTVINPRRIHNSSSCKMLASSVAKDYLVCKVGDLPENQMKEFEIAQGKNVLLVNNNGTFTALGPKCTHYGAPLAKGALCEGRVRCPWHGACFNATTGDIEDYPGLDSLVKFETFVKDGNVRVKASETELANGTRTKNLARRDPKNKQVFLIVGGGAAAQACAEVLRQEGFTGDIVMATKESNLPYDRPKLSKAMDVDVKNILLRPKDFYESCDIRVCLNKEATSIDIIKKKVTFKDGENLNYDKILIATGGTPNNINAKGNSLKNVCMLRTPEDAFYIARASQGKDVVVVGSSFIGMEVASFLSEKANSVTIISRSGIPFANVLGKPVGNRLKALFEENGVKFLSGRTVAEFRGKSGALSEILLDNKDVVKADICVLGLGVRPSTDFVNGSGIPVTKTGSIIVNKQMKTEVDNVFAAGDIVEFPLFLRENQRVSIGHWQMAHAHGRAAALNMLDKSVELRSVPYFWTVLFKKSVRYAGYGEGFDNVVIEGDLEGLQFVAFYTRGNSVVAAASLNSDPVVSRFAEHLASGKTVCRDGIGAWLKA